MVCNVSLPKFLMRHWQAEREAGWYKGNRRVMPTVVYLSRNFVFDSLLEHIRYANGNIFSFGFSGERRWVDEINSKKKKKKIPFRRTAKLRGPDQARVTKN